MSSKVQIRRGTTSDANSFQGAEGELYVDLSQNDLRVHNGTTPGGFRLPNIDHLNLIAGNKVDKLSPALPNSGTIGSSTSIPVLSYNDQGQITAVSSAALPNNLATTTYVDTAVSNLVNAAPATLNTLNELAAALGNDSNFVTTVTNNLATKAPINNPTFTGLVKLQQVSEKIKPLTNSNGVVNHDFNDGAIWYHKTILGSFSINLLNVPTTSNYNTIVTLILEQGSTPYIPTSIQINGTTFTIMWLNGEAPSGNANSIDIVSFSLVNTSVNTTQFIVLGSLTKYA